MRKIRLILPVFLALSVLLSACSGNNADVPQSTEPYSTEVISMQETSVTENSLPSVSSAPEQASGEAEPVSAAPAEPEETAARLYNVRDYGAKGNGDAEDSAAFQAAIDAAAKKGGTVWVPAGKYNIGKTVYKKAKVSIKGEGMWVSTLVWVGGANGVIIDTSNEALWGTSIEDLYFTNGMLGGVTAILGGSTLQKYNSAIGTFKNLVFFNLGTAIRGDAEPSGVGIFDCYFENVFCSQCDVGLHLYGSGNTVVHPRIATCKNGIILDYLNGESFDGMHVIGGIFASNTTDIRIPSASGIRPTDFVGTWFETASQGILNIDKPNTRVMNLTFRDCMLNSSADNKEYFLFDARNAAGTVTLDSCTVVEDRGILAPTATSSVFRIDGLQVYDSKGIYVYRDSDGGKCTVAENKTERRVSHKLRAEPSRVMVTPANEAAASAKYYVTATDGYIIITVTERPVPGDLEFYWEVSR